MDAGMKIKKEMNGTNGTTNGTNGTNGYPVNGKSVSNRGLNANIQTLLGASKWYAKHS